MHATEVYLTPAVLFSFQIIYVFYTSRRLAQNSEKKGGTYAEKEIKEKIAGKNSNNKK